jgi:amino acid permease
LTGFVAAALVVFAIVIVVGATVFRWQRAIEALRVLRRIGWGYVIAIVVLAVIYGVRNGGL